MVAARLVNMAVGLLTLPVLIRFLGGEAFAAWALLLALAGGFSLLELGMPPAVVRMLARPLQQDDRGGARLWLGRSWVLLALAFGGGALLLSACAGQLAGWLRLPATPWFDGPRLVLLVFGAVAARAFLQSGTLVWIASGRFGRVALVSVLQPLAANMAAMAAAWRWGRLDAALVAFWAAQLSVVAAAFLLARCPPRFGRAACEPRALRELGRFGVASQLEAWAQFANFQLDKFLVAGLIGLWAVAPYEVANRAAAALRSVPASGADTFLTAAVLRADDREGAWRWYLASTRMAAYGVILFMLTPLAVAPVFLYAWTGEMGWHGRWVFCALIAGAAANVIALPAATLAQAEGRTALLARAAALSLAANLPLSLLMLSRWGAAGAAAGSALAMAAGAAVLVHGVHRHAGQPLRPTMARLARLWPPVLLCLLWLAAGTLVFQAWLAGTAPPERFARETRLVPGLLGVAAWLCCLASVVVLEWRRGAITAGERRRVRSALAGRFR
jgi:O-antigen/teichoic acid export membrane protein